MVSVVVMFEGFGCFDGVVNNVGVFMLDVVWEV